MRLILRSVAAALSAAAVLAACNDGAAPTALNAPAPASIEVVAGQSQSVTAGLAVAVTPTFVVRDEQGNAMNGVRVTVAVTRGGGTLAGAPSRTSGTTPVGTWTAGTRSGVNEITITVAGLSPLIVTAEAVAGAPARLSASPLAASAPVVGSAAAEVSATITDNFDNPVASAAVSVSVTGGGSASNSVVSGAQGVVRVADWTLGKTTGLNTLTFAAGGASASVSLTTVSGPPAALSVTGAQSAKAGATIGPISVRAIDQYGNAATSGLATFAVTAGGGSIAATTAAAGPTGVITVPAWTLGKSAVPQRLRATVGSLTTEIDAAVQTDFNIEVRFYGPPMSASHEALFRGAAARLSGIITGNLPSVNAFGINAAAFCGMSGLPVMNEVIDDVVIFASVQSIDGPGKILAQAGPCGFRDASQGQLPAIGVMEFDSADLQTLAGQGSLEEVIMHEMLHVLGIGTLWQSRGFLTGIGTTGVAYTGAGAIQGCKNAGGTSTCALTVPVENSGGPGTINSHWRESTFHAELMTGYASAGGMPLSLITVGGLADLGYTVNTLAADPFFVPTGAAAPLSKTDVHIEPWERRIPGPGGVLPPAGGPGIQSRNE